MDEVKSIKEKIYEVYTCSGKRITVKGVNAITYIQARDLIIYDAAGNATASFQLENIEGWRVIE